MYGIIIYITPTTLDDLTVCNKDFPAGSSTLDGFEEEDGKLKGHIKALDTTDIIEIVSSGYVKQTFTWYDLTQNPDITLVPKSEFKKTSDGTNDYYCKDESARERLDLLSKDAITGVTGANVTTALGYTPADDTRVVHLAGTETITGKKEFTSDPWFMASQIAAHIKNNNIDINVIPDSNQYEYFNFVDKNDARIGTIGALRRNNVYYGVYLQAGNEGLLGLYTNGTTAFATAPASDAGSSIVTTVNKSKSADGYFKLGNGLIIQWGIASGSGTSRTVTLPTAFSNTNYKVTVSPHNGNVSATTWGVYSETTTTFDIRVSGNGSGMNANWIAIGY